ncbi:MAG: hypothetical protein JRD93_05515 [Deltaproteobacteria bacterium]|nr:hypothetical protein [Deltaproteobacteria bacterium]MBW2661442.1 hypothetical protein [Deltaproteobacteria bacterium]
MITYYINRELSQKLEINLAKWKRWSREFLPPDPLGGMQSGYARQYTVENAFTVYLGGHLVADMKFAMPDAKQILNDLHKWLMENRFYFISKAGSKSSKGVDNLVKKYTIFIYCMNLEKTTIGFYYKIRGIISDETVDYNGFQVRQEHFTETIICPQTNKHAALDLINVKMLNITELHEKFLVNLDL